MVNSKKNIDLSLLELFKSELENNSRIIENGLIELEKNYNFDNLENIMRAAHSIKGAARIVGFEIAVKLAHSIEDLLEKALKQNYKLSTTDIDNLLKGNDVFLDLLKDDYKNIPDNLERNSKNIEEISIKIINHQLNNEILAKNPPKNETSNIVTFSENYEKVDDFMIELFINEFNKEFENICNYKKLYTEDQKVEYANQILTSIHSLKGASRIIKLEPLNFLTTKIEEYLINKIDNKNIINIDFTEICNFLKGATSCTIDNIYEYFYDNKQNVIELVNKLFQQHNVIVEETFKTKPIINILDNNVSNNKKNQIDDKFITVYSENLNKILGLSGELLIQTKLLKPYINKLLSIKKDFLQITSYKDFIEQQLFDYSLSKEIKEKFDESSILLDKVLSSIIDYIQNFENFSRRVEITADKLYSEAINTRMKPFSEGINGFQRMVRDLSKKLNKKVNLVIKGENTRVDKDVLEKLESSLSHLVSNAIDHGIETPEERVKLNKNEFGTITIEAKHQSGMLFIIVSDDGRGINLDKLKNKIIENGYTSKEIVETLSKSELFEFLFLPGFSTKTNTSEISGRGVGLDIVFTAVSEIGGIIKVDSNEKFGTTFVLQLPLTLSVMRSLLVEINNQTYAFPLSKIERALTVNANDILNSENSQYIIYENENLGIIDANQVFNNKNYNLNKKEYNIIVISDKYNKYGIVIDKFINQKDLVLLPLDKKLGKIPNISNGAILDDGNPTLVIDVDDLVRSIDLILKNGRTEKIIKKVQDNNNRLKKVLIVEDSVTVRQVEKKLLENKGYHVTLAVDGVDGWNILNRGEGFDLIISDIDMPRMNGIELVKKIRNEEKYKDLPIMIVSYKDREEDKLKGLEAGANYYLTKSSFHDDTLVEAVIDLIGAA